MASVNWSELNSDVLFLIFNKLSVPDCIRCSVVCLQWNLVIKSSRQSRQLTCPTAPWLMLQHGTNNTTAEFLSATEQIYYNIPIPIPKPSNSFPASDKPLVFSFGGSNGWLITSDENYNVRLMHPINFNDICLPSLTTIPFQTDAPDEDGVVTYFEPIYDKKILWPRHPLFLQGYFVKAAMSTDLSSTSLDEVTVMMIHVGPHVLSFTRVTDESWKVLGNSFYSEVRGYQDVIFHKGKFHTMSIQGMIEMWEPHGLSLKPRVVAPKLPDYRDPKLAEFQKDNPEFFDSFIKPETFNILNFRNFFLVESADGDKLMIVIVALHKEDYTRRGFSGKRLKVNMIKVLLWNTEKLKWMHIKSLGDQVLFLGTHHSVCQFADIVPNSQPNCIYFANRHDAGVFCMEDNSIRPLGLTEDETESTLSKMWFTPRM